MTAVQIIFPGRPLGDTNAIDTIADLRAVDSTDTNDNTNIIVANVGIFKWDAASSASDDGVSVIKPDDRTGLQTGRWLLIGGVSEVRTFESFGAKGDVQNYLSALKADGTPATDDTAAIQAAIDWAFAGGVEQPRAIQMTAKFFLVGQITTYPTTTIVGTGRMTSWFVCKTGTTGKWISDRGEGAQKQIISGITFGARNNTSITHIFEAGNDGIQFGTQGIYSDLWFRDGLNAYAFEIDANVGFIRNFISENCRHNGLIRGNANQVSEICSMQAGQGTTGAISGGPASIVGLELYGCFVDFCEIEATETGQLPLKINGDCYVSNLIISTAFDASHSHLIEVDETNYIQWSVTNFQAYGEETPVTNGVVKRTPTNTYIGSPTLTINQMSRLNLLPIAPIYYAQAKQAFGIRLENPSGTARNSIGQIGDPSTAGGVHDKIIGATNAATNTSTTVFAGGMIINGSGKIILNTAAQELAYSDLQVSLDYTNYGTVFYPNISLQSTTVNSVVRVRPVIELRDKDGVAVDVTPASGKILLLSVRGTLA